MKDKNAYEMRNLTDKQILNIYTDVAKQHFPKAELKPVAIINRLLEDGGYEGIGLFSQDKLVGYAFFVKVPHNDVLLLDYYAVLEEFRNGGTGSLFLQKMQESFRQRAAIILETEEPDQAEEQDEYDIRVRRNLFYERNGAVRTDVKSRLYIVEFGIFYIPLLKTFTDSQICEQLDCIYKYMFDEEDYRKYVHLRREEQGG